MSNPSKKPTKGRLPKEEVLSIRNILGAVFNKLRFVVTGSSKDSLTVTQKNGIVTMDISVDGAGKSAYDIAVDNGFVGTEEEWLQSLVGMTGEQGPAGADGDGTAYYGQTARQTNGTISIAASGTYYPINLASTIDSANSFGMIAGTGVALKNDTGESQLFTVIGSADCRSSNNELLGLKLAVGGVVIDASDCRANTGSNNYGKLLSQWIIELGDGEEVQLYIANHSATKSIDVNRCKLVAFTAGRSGGGGGSNGFYSERAYYASGSSLETDTLAFMTARVNMTISRIDAEVQGGNPPTIRLYRDGVAVGSNLVIDGDGYGDRLYKSDSVDISVSAGQSLTVVVEDTGEYMGSGAATGPLMVGLEWSHG